MSRSDVLIVGGGIGGLATALAIDGVGGREVTVVEAAPEVRPLGVGINLLPHAVTAVERLGLLPKLEEIGLAVDQMSYFDRFGSFVCSVPRGVGAGYRLPQYSVHRGRFQSVLLDAVRERVGDAAVITGREVTGLVEHLDRVEVLHQDVDGTGVVADGATETGVLVGADGVHSRVRAELHGPGQIMWSGRVMWRGVSRIDSPFLTAGTVLFAGYPDQRFIAYPIRDLDGRTVVNWIAAYRIDDEQPAPENWNRRVDAEQVAQHYSGWNAGGLDISAVIRAAEAVFEYPMTDRDPLASWSTKRVTLLGDAAHPMYPTGSQGSSQALLDAIALSEELAASDGVASAALQRYEERRREATNRVVLANREMADARVLEVVHTRAPEGFARIEDVISQQEIDEINGAYARTAGYDPDSLERLARATP